MLHALNGRRGISSAYALKPRWWAVQ